MIYLTSGANGAGKTLFTLKDVRELQLSSNRPVAYNGRFDMVSEFGWKKIEASKWQDEPDGTIFLFDEAHHDFPLRRGGQALPDYVLMMGEHRKRGFDFFIISQHPQKIDVEVRRLIGSPGWHRHFMAVGPGLVSERKWNFSNPNCEKPGAADDGETRTRLHPKEVYAWYSSASLHTATARIPRAVFVLIAALIAIPSGIWYAYRSLSGASSSSSSSAAAALKGSVATGPSRVSPPGEVKLKQRQKVQEYLAAREPRLEGLAHTAPVYDKVTEPSQAPFPAACVAGKFAGGAEKDCRCWSQQGTLLQVPSGVCLQVVANGYFMEWHQEARNGPLAAPMRLVQGSGAPVVVSAPVPAQAASGAPVSAGLWIGGPQSERPEFSEQDRATGGAIRAMRSSPWRYPG